MFEGNTLDKDQSRLILCYRSGEFYIINNLRECDMRKFSFGFDEILAGIWNKEGTGFCLSVKVKQKPLIHLFDQNGLSLKYFQFPKSVRFLDFNHSSNKLVCSNSNLLYLSKIKKNYSYCYLSSISVFAILFETPPNESVLFLYDLKTKKMKKKMLRHCLSLHSNSKDTLIIVTRHAVLQNEFKAIMINSSGGFVQSVNLVQEPAHVVVK